MAAIHFPESTATPPPEPTQLDVVEPEPSRKRFKTWSRRTTVIVGSLALVLIGALTWVTTRPATPLPAPSVSLPSPAGFAELYLRTYLMNAGEGSEETVAPYLGYAPDLAGMTAGSWYVADIVAIEIIEHETASTVILAADLLGAVAGGYADAGTHFYAVDVSSTDSGLLAVGLPSEVAGPVPDTTDVDRPALAPPPDNPITAAVQDYLNWYLAGAKGSYGGPRPDAAYRSVTIRSMSTPDLSVQPAPIQLHVAALDGDGRSTVLSYSLVVANQQGMWVASHP